MLVRTVFYDIRIQQYFLIFTKIKKNALTLLKNNSNEILKK